MAVGALFLGVLLSNVRGGGRSKSHSPGLTEIAEWYDALQVQYLPLVPPVGEAITFDAGVFGIDPRHFPDAFVDGLVGQEDNGFVSYAIVVMEEPSSLVRCFYTMDGNLIGAIPAPPDYDPDATTTSTPGGAEPWQVRVVFHLIHIDDLAAFETSPAPARAAEASLLDDGGTQPRNGSEPFRVTAIAMVGLQTELTFPGDEACYYTIETCPDLEQGSWTTIDLFPGLAADMTWTSPDNLDAPQFFRVHQIPLSAPEDQDQDGLNDVEELTQHQTGPLNADSDGDGLSDGWEVQNEYSPTTQNHVIDLTSADVEIQTKAMYAYCEFNSWEEPCVSFLDGYYWDLVVEHDDWPAKGIFTIDCTDPLDDGDWNLQSTQSSAEYAYRITESDNRRLHRILYRYFPTAPTQDREIYRLTVLERFQSHPLPSTSVSTHRIRTLLLSGDGTNEHFFEPADGFDIDEQGDLICEPDEEGYIIPTVIKVDIEVNDTDTDDDDIVCRYSTDPAGRPTITCRARIQGLGFGYMDVVLKNKAGDGEVRFSAEGETTKTLSLPSSGAWVSFNISGQVKSTRVNDAVIEAHLESADGPVCGDEALSVLWVENFRLNASVDPFNSTATVSDDNSAEDWFKGTFDADGKLGAYYIINLNNGITTEIIADVYPEDFVLPVRHERTLTGSRTYYNGGIDDTFGGDPSKSNTDNSHVDSTQDEEIRDDLPGGTGANQIYDIDGPGFLVIGDEPQNSIMRRRINFQQYATFHLTDADEDRTRCADDFEWFYRCAFKVLNPDTPTWGKDDTAPTGDNKIGEGTTEMGYDLGPAGTLPDPLPTPRL